MAYLYIRKASKATAQATGWPEYVNPCPNPPTWLNKVSDPMDVKIKKSKYLSFTKKHKDIDLIKFSSKHLKIAQ
jgi:hypothetical protein